MKRSILLVTLLLIVSILLTGCNNPRAENEAQWYLPWTWGDKTLQQSIEEGCQGGAISTSIAGSVYPCPSTTSDAPAAPTPASPTAAPAVQPPTPEPVAPTPATPTDCRVIHDYQLKDLTEVSTSNDGWLHVEYWLGGDTPEYETILPGGRYLLRANFAGGHVWEYSGCTFEQVKNQVQAHINRRLAQKANNGGYVEWQATGFFNPVR